MNRIREIREAFRLFGTDKLQHGYAMVYAQVPPDIKYLLEIGSGSGASVRAWLELFPVATIYTIDKERNEVDHGSVHHTQCDLGAFSFNEDKNFELIVDDASHQVDHILTAWNHLYKYCKGLYVIEDVGEEDDRNVIVKEMRKNCNVISEIQCESTSGDVAIVASFDRVILW